MAARPAVPKVTSAPEQGQVYCNTPITTSGGVTYYCAQALLHDGKHVAANGGGIGVNVSLTGA